MNGTDEPWLEQEQKELLSTLAHAHRRLDRSQRQDFVLDPSLVRTKGVISRERVREATANGVVGYGADLIRSEDELPANWDKDLVRHPGLEGGVVEVFIGDLDALKLEELLYFRDDTHFSITPKGLRYEASLLKENTSMQTAHPGLTQTRPNPRAFISYTWESEEHKAWVREFAERLVGDGVVVTLDQWQLFPGDQMPAFMERAVRENDYVLVVCTPAYKKKSDNRQGGAGYEGDIITGEIVNGANRRKFIPIHRLGEWKEAAPSWLAGSYYINLKDTPYDQGNYNDLTNTLHGLRPTAPVVGPAPTQARPVGPVKATLAAPPSSTPPVSRVAATEYEPIRILNLIVDEVTKPRNDGTVGSALYTVPFQLSRTPSNDWAEVFVQAWDNPSEFTSMHRSGISRVAGSKILLEGTTVEEVEQYHKKTLKLAVDKTNRIIEEHEAKLRRRAEVQHLNYNESELAMRDAASRISFDD